jgi:hypothetical protein
LLPPPTSKPPLIPESDVDKICETGEILAGEILAGAALNMLMGGGKSSSSSTIAD